MALYLQRVRRDCLRERKLLVVAGGSCQIVDLTYGVSQGPLLGPTLWNVLYASASTISRGSHGGSLCRRCEGKDRGRSHGQGGLGHPEDPGLHDVDRSGVDAGEDGGDCYGRKSIRPSRMMKYLGVWLDDRRSFIPHVRPWPRQPGAVRTYSELRRTLGGQGVPRGSAWPQWWRL